MTVPHFRTMKAPSRRAATCVRVRLSLFASNRRRNSPKYGVRTQDATIACFAASGLRIGLVGCSLGLVRDTLTVGLQGTGERHAGDDAKEVWDRS